MTVDEIRLYIGREDSAAAQLAALHPEQAAFWEGHRNAYKELLRFLDGGDGAPVPSEPKTPVLTGMEAL